MEYDFDRIVDRKDTFDMKWHSRAVEAYIGKKIPEDIVPMWVADTEFACPPVIVEVVKKRAEKEIFGYCTLLPEVYRAICFWQKKRFHWEVQPEWIASLPSVVAGINIAIRAFSEKGDGVIIQEPVYNPFAEIIRNTERTVVNNGLKCVDGHYEMNYEELEVLASKPENKMMILCSPHNPVGRVWTEEELRKTADICLKNEVMLVVDEIHSDIVFEGHRHLPLLSLDQKYRERFISLGAPGKSFNVAGLKFSMAFIPNETIRKRFCEMQISMSLDIKNTFGLEAVVAAYTDEGEEWLEQELAYMQSNVEYLLQFVEEKMPGVKMIRPEGTFLGWLDFSEMGLTEKDIFRKIFLEAGVIGVPGTWFGKGGEQHLRVNYGCPRSLLVHAMEKIRTALY